jgi:branched-chain amino acid transport system permease protein
LSSEALVGKLIFDGLSMGLVFVILATGLVLIASVNKILFMAYGMFYTVGAYTTWYAVHLLQLPYFASLIIGVLGAGILGILCYLLIFQRLQRMPGAFLATLIASMGLLMILGQGGLLVFGTVPRSIPAVFPGTLHWFGINITIAKLALIVIGIAVTLFLFWVYEKTAIGRSMRAVAFLPEAAALQGINNNRIYLVTLGMGTALAGIAGGLLAPSYGINPQMGNNVLWTVMLLAMLGGIDSLLGAVAGGLVIGQVLSFGQFYIGGTIQIVVFVFIGTVLYFKPAGLLGRGIDIGI